MPETGSVGVTTTSYFASTNPTTTQTTSSTVLSTDVTYAACSATETGVTTTAETTAACTLLPTQVARRAEPFVRGGAVLAPRQSAAPGPDDVDFSCEQPSDTTMVIWIKDDDQGDPKVITDLLDRRKQQNSRGYYEARSTEMQATFFYYGYNMHPEVAYLFGNQSQVCLHSLSS